MDHPVVLAVVVLDAKSRMRLSPPRAHRMDVDERRLFIVLGHTFVIPCSQVRLQEGKQVLAVEMMQPSFCLLSQQPKASRVAGEG
jgi:hypothetical protein